MLRRILVPSLLLAAFGAAAYAGGDPIRIEPGWSYASFKRAAIVPTQLPAALRDNAAAVEAARTAYLTFEDYMRSSTDFTVIPREETEKLCGQFDFSKIADGTEPMRVVPADAITTADVLFISVLDVYDTRAERRTEKRTRYAKEKSKIKRDSRGLPIPIEDEELTIMRHEARAGGVVYVVDASTGKLLLTHKVEPIEIVRELRNDPPSESPTELGKIATEALGLDFYRGVAPQSVEIKTKSSLLVVAFDYYDNTYDETKVVYPTLEDFVVAVRDLPWQCNRLPFKLAVGLKGGRDLWTQPFKWTHDNPATGIMFRVPIKLLAATDQEKFELRLYAPGGAEPIEDRPFKLEDPGD